MLLVCSVAGLLYLALVGFMYAIQSSLVYLPDLAGRELVATPEDMGLHTHQRWQDAPRLARPSPRVPIDCAVLSRQRGKYLPSPGQHQYLSSAGVERPDPGLSGLWAQHRQAVGTGYLPGCPGGLGVSYSG